MRWTRPQHTRWLAACLLVLLLSVWAGGFSFSALVVFAVIFAAGAALLSSSFSAPTVPEWPPAAEADSPDEEAAEADIPDEEADADSPAEVAEDPQPVSD